MGKPNGLVAMAKRLSAAGITTVAQLYATTATQLRNVWGSVEGARFHAWMQEAVQDGEGGGTVAAGGRKHVAVADGVVLDGRPLLPLPVQKAAMRLRHTGHYAGSLSVSVRYQDDTRWSDGC